MSFATFGISISRANEHLFDFDQERITTVRVGYNSAVEYGEYIHFLSSHSRLTPKFLELLST